MNKFIQRKILVIDDEQELLAMMKVMLEEKGYQVFCAANGPEGIRINEQENPDLIILDLNMPGMNGIETLLNIRATDANVRVIILTGFGSSDSIRNTAGLNVSEYLSKPFENDALLQVVKNNLPLNMGRGR
jgi:DNA-binding response OmpR family regulator